VSWGGDPSRFVLMGHSAGAHPVALLAADPRAGVRCCSTRLLQGSCLLDATPPRHRLSGRTPPWLAVCPSRRNRACDQANGLAQRAGDTGGCIHALPLDRLHCDINESPGFPGHCTARVDAVPDGAGTQCSPAR
jgi:hypothetical protein